MQLRNILLIISFAVFLQSCKSTEEIQQKNTLAVEVLTLLKALDNTNNERLVLVKKYLDFIHVSGKYNFPNALKQLKKIQNSVPKQRQNAKRKTRLYLKKNTAVNVFLTDLLARIDADKSIEKNKIYIDTYNGLEGRGNVINVLIKKYNVISEKSNGYYKKYSIN